MNKHESSFMTFEKLSLIWGGGGSNPPSSSRESQPYSWISIFDRCDRVNVKTAGTEIVPIKANTFQNIKLI